MADSVVWQSQLASRVSSMVTTAKELTLEASMAAGARFGEDGASPKKAELITMLSSRFEKDKVEGLKRVIALVMRDSDCSEYFAEVIKNISNPNLQARKLVYIYLLRYAESEPDLALLSINAIQKSLSDKDQLIRASAIRVMSSIRVPVISGIVVLAIKKCITDLSPYVRRAAAMAIPKCFALDPSHEAQLIEYISTLLNDPSYFVLGAAAGAFLQVCPDRLDLIHPQYRRICRLLPDIEEWGQVDVLQIMAAYCRTFFANGGRRARKKDAGFYSDEEDEAAEGGEYVLDPDIQLLLDTLQLLFTNRNSAVILAVVKVYRHIAPANLMATVVPPLIRLLRTPKDISYIALQNIVAIALSHPELFHDYATHFFLFPADGIRIASLKLEVLTLICNPSNQLSILSELQYNAASSDDAIARASIQAIGQCAQTSDVFAGRCVKWLLNHVTSSNDIVCAAALNVIRQIVQSDPDKHVKTVIRIANVLPTTLAPSARASIIWLVGENSQRIPRVYPDVLRQCARSFMAEDVLVKLQIVTLAAKVYTRHVGNTSVEKDPNHPIPLLFDYIMQLARYDLSYELRDRVRMYQSLLSKKDSVQLASLVLQAAKPSPHQPSPSHGREKFIIGSTSLAVGSPVRGYTSLPEWPTDWADCPPSSVRAENVPSLKAPVHDEIPQAVVSKPAPPSASSSSQFQPSLDIQTERSNGKIQSLDEFFGEEDSEEEVEGDASTFEDDEEYETDTDAGTGDETEETSMLHSKDS